MNEHTSTRILNCCIHLQTSGIEYNPDLYIDFINCIRMGCAFIRMECVAFFFEFSFAV